MHIKERLKSISFWTGLAGAVILVLGAFGVEIGEESANAVINAVCTLLVFLGIASSPKTPDNVADESEYADDCDEQNADGDADGESKSADDGNG